MCGYSGGVCGERWEAWILGGGCGCTKLWWCSVFGVDHVSGVAKEIDIDFVVNNFIPLSTKSGAH